MPNVGARRSCRAVRGLRRDPRRLQFLRDRHCPKCQGLARLQWLADRRAELLPVAYFHVVFTVPSPIAAIALQNKALVYDILFKAAAQTIRVIAADPEHLGAETGMIAILRTWGRPSPIIPMFTASCRAAASDRTGAGSNAGRTSFCPFIFSRAAIVACFSNVCEQPSTLAALCFTANSCDCADPSEFAQYLEPLANIPWVVFAKRPFAGPSQVLEYLGRYTHRVAIANGRLLDCHDGRVSFRWKDSAPKTSPRR